MLQSYTFSQNLATLYWALHILAATGVQYVADLYTAVGDNPKKESYVQWNLRGQYRIAKWVDVWVRGDNLLAQKYEINDGYPMPRATVMAGFNFNF